MRKLLQIKHLLKLLCLAITLIVIFFIAGFSQEDTQELESVDVVGIPQVATTGVSKFKVLLVNSYNQSYRRSGELVDGVLKGFKIVINGNDNDFTDRIIDNSACSVCLRIYHMDTKRCPSEEFKLQAGEKAQKIIDEWKPDLVIVAEDNAAIYVASKYHKTSDIPFVFCGVNWDASEYRFARATVTGMIEIDFIEQAIDMLKPFIKGDRIGILGEDNESNRKSTDNYISQLGMKFEKVVYVANFADWKKAYVEMQKEVDVIIMEPPCFLLSILGEAERADAKKFIHDNTIIPTVSTECWVSDYALLVLGKSPSEFGEWSAITALRILDGEKPEDIPIAKNERMFLYLNMPLAKKLGYLFPMEMLDNAIIGD